MRTAVLYNFLIEANIMASIAILLMIPVRRFLRGKLGNSALCFGWLLVAIRLLCPLTLPNPLINGIRSPFAPDAAIRPIAGQLQVRFQDAIGALDWRANGRRVRVQLLDTLSSASGNGRLSLWLMRVVLIGMAVVALWFLVSNIRFRHQLRADRIEPLSGKLKDEYEAMCRARGVKPLPVYYTDPLPSACLVGVIHPWIALPLTAKPGDVLPVLTHEICHYRGGDHLWALLRLVCCTVHWFNPLVWLAAQMSRTDMELRCDDRVVRTMDTAQKEQYASILVLAAARRDLPGVGVLATGMTMTGRKLKSRVNAILHSPRVMKVLSVGFCALASLCLVGAFATAEYVAQVHFPQVNAELSEPQALGNVNDASERAQALWQSDWLSEDTSGGSWQSETKEGDPLIIVEEEAGEGRYYQVKGFLPGGNLTMNLTPDGRVTALENEIHGGWLFDYDLVEGRAIDSLLGEGTVDNVWEWVMAFWAQVDPERAKQVGEVVNDGCWQHGDQVWLCYTDFATYPAHQMSFYVQVLPTLRIVSMGGSNG